MLETPLYVNKRALATAVIIIHIIFPLVEKIIPHYKILKLYIIQIFDTFENKHAKHPHIHTQKTLKSHINASKNTQFVLEFSRLFA